MLKKQQKKKADKVKLVKLKSKRNKIHRQTPIIILIFQNNNSSIKKRETKINNDRGFFVKFFSYFNI